MIYGYFTDLTQEFPEFDPWIDNVPCPSCGDLLQLPVKTISLMVPGQSRSYFYRTHKDCYDALDGTQRTALDRLLISAIAITGHQN